MSFKKPDDLVQSLELFMNMKYNLTLFYFIFRNISEIYRINQIFTSQECILYY